MNEIIGHVVAFNFNDIIVLICLGFVVLGISLIVIGRKKAKANKQVVAKAKHNYSDDANFDPIRILQKRLVNGDISASEYTEIFEALKPTLNLHQPTLNQEGE